MNRVQLLNFRVLLHFVSSEALNGSQSKNPFILKNLKMGIMVCNIDGREYRFDASSKDKLSIDTYYQLVRDMYRIRNGERGQFALTRPHLDNNYYVACINSSKSK